MSIWKQITEDEAYSLTTDTRLAEQYAKQADAELDFLRSLSDMVDAMDSLDRVNKSILSHQ